MDRVFIRQQPNTAINTKETAAGPEKKAALFPTKFSSHIL